MKRGLSPRHKGTKEEGLRKPHGKGMTELRAGFVYGSHSTLRTNLLPPSLGGPVWPKAIQRSGVRNDHLSF
jgi:hypothetical protein